MLEGMNEFAAKKLGEVLAFANVGLETLNKAHAGIVQAWSNDEIKLLVDGFSKQRDAIADKAKVAGVGDTTSTKAEATAIKLRSMRDAYVGDEWDNPAEIMEWLGFFEGSAMVHWALVRGAAEALDDALLKQTADDAITFHHDFLNDVRSKLMLIGKNRASS